MLTPIDRLQVSTPQQEPPAKPAVEKVDKISAVARVKAEMNVSIMQSAKVDIGSKDNSLMLLFNTAIDKINEKLAPELGNNAIQKGYENGLDISPEATAERIVNLSTLSYQAFKQNHKNESEAVVLDKYIKVISSGIDQGFGEARTILDGLNVLQGDIATNIDKTYELVQEKLASFKQLVLGQTNPSNDSKVDGAA